MKQDNIAETVERYVYDVTRRLPQYQKEDISRELHSLIDDMLEAQTVDVPTEQDLHKVLVKLGEPKKLANQYREKKRYLIGPSYFDQYVMMLKIVLPCVFLGITVASFLNVALVTSSDYTSTAINYFASAFSALFQGFVWVTIIFACIEYNAEKNPAKNIPQAPWNPSDLPQIPSNEAIIRKSEPIVGIVFTILIIILFNFAPQLMGVFSTTNGFSAVPIFDLQVLKISIPLFNLSFAVGAIREFFKLLYGRHSIKLAVIVLVLNVITVCLTVAVFSNGAIWNPNFVQSLSEGKITALPANFSLDIVWSNMNHLFIAIIVFATVIDSAVYLVKGIKADRA